MHCNVTSIKKHKEEICARFNKFDILSINETNLKPDNLFSLPGYKIFRNDRPDRQGGGVLLALRNNLICHEKLNKTIENNEGIAVQIETPLGHLLIASIYIPPNKNKCKRSSTTTSSQQVLDDGFLQCIDNDLTTYARNNYEEKIDWILASQPTILFIDNVETETPLGLKEDHKPLTFNLNMTADNKPSSPRLSFNFKSANWQLYRKTLNELLTGSKMCSDKVWGTVRKFHNKRAKQSHSANLIYQNITSNSDHDKVNLFASYFENEIFVEKPDHLPFHNQVRKKVDRIKRILKGPVNRILTSPITIKEIKTILKQFPNSSPGPDSIHNRCLKNYTALLFQHLEKIYNSIIDIGHIPNIWKNTNIILLLKKKKDKKQPSSYRPISFLSCIGKILEKIIKQRMAKELNERKILPIHQAGFREHKSTMYNIYRLERFAHEHLDKRQHAAVIFFDVKAAFDTVWFDALIYKLYDLRLPSYLIRYIVSFLDNRTASIEIENSLSKPFLLRSGTPQGSPLSPLLYILYTSDSMNCIHQHTEHGLFADDTALWASSNTITNLKNRLQSSINEFQN
ncbi:unnamed protein product [Rotaria socialis]